MTYHLNRGQFVENGPSLLAERDRRVRAAGHAHRLLAARAVPPAPLDAIILDAAA